MTSRIADAHAASYAAHQALKNAKRAGSSPNVLDDIEAAVKNADAAYRKAVAVAILADALGCR